MLSGPHVYASVWTCIPGVSALAKRRWMAVSGNIVRWEVRVVVSATGTTGIWAWAQGFRQFYQEYPVDLRGRSLTVNAYNMQ